MYYLGMMMMTMTMLLASSVKAFAPTHLNRPAAAAAAAAAANAWPPPSTTIHLQAASAIDDNHADKTDPPKEPTRVVIVGGGVGGLALASRLATLASGRHSPGNRDDDDDAVDVNDDAKISPLRITLLEQNDDIGGRCGSTRIETEYGTFRHERGPSLWLLPQVYRDVFENCGGSSNNKKTMADYGLTIQPCLPAYQAIFDDGDRIEVGFPQGTGSTTSSPTIEQDDLAQRRQASYAKMNEWQSNGADQWQAYLQACQAFLDCGFPNFIQEKLDLASFPAFLRESFRDRAKAWPLKPHSEVLDAFFTSTKLRALASFQDLYVGLEPYRNPQQPLGGVLTTTAPAVFGLLSAIELQPPDDRWCGVYAPLGGFDAVAQSLQALARDCGVAIVLDIA